MLNDIREQLSELSREWRKQAATWDSLADGAAVRDRCHDRCKAKAGVYRAVAVDLERSIKDAMEAVGKRNIMFDCAATIVTTKEFDDLTVAELVEAMRARLDRIQQGNEIEAFGLCDEYQEEENN